MVKLNKHGKHLIGFSEKDICYQKRGRTMQNRPAIVAVGRTKFGEHYGKEPEKLIEEAWLSASQECGIERKDLEACYLSDCFLPITNKLGLEEGFLSELTELHVPMEVTRSVSAALLTASHAMHRRRRALRPARQRRIRARDFWRPHHRL